MIYINIILISAIYFFLVSCASEFMGAERIVYKSGFYVERWYLNPEYGRDDIPKGTKLYGNSADNVKHRFIVRYYVEDSKNSEFQIPSNHIWISNASSILDEDDDDYFYYEYCGNGDYRKFKTSKSKLYLKIKEDYLLPIMSCNNGWCKLYPNNYSDNLYVKESILVRPLE